MNEQRNCFYRISVKALILNESGNKFLICQKENGVWELPGGGLDWGTTPQEDLPREIREEMGLETTWVASNPSYFATCQNHDKTIWVANILYETKLENFNFTPSDECVNIKFVNKENLQALEVFPTVVALADMFDSRNHDHK